MEKQLTENQKYWIERQRKAELLLVAMWICTPLENMLDILQTIKRNNGLKSIKEARNKVYITLLFNERLMID